MAEYLLTIVRNVFVLKFCSKMLPVVTLVGDDRGWSLRPSGWFTLRALGPRR